MSQELTLKEVAEHKTKKDLYVIVHDKVYDCSTFVDEHPYVHIYPCFHLTRTCTCTANAGLKWNVRGGEEVLLDVAGQDGTEAFEDVGHSDEAREILEGLVVGSVKRLVRLNLPTLLLSVQLTYKFHLLHLFYLEV